jgi:hypothetical protein
MGELRVHTSTNQATGKIKGFKGFLPERFSNAKVEARHLVYIYLTRLAFEVDNQEIHPNLNVVSEHLNYSTQHIQRNIKQLVEEGLLVKIKSKGLTRGYRIVDKYFYRQCYLIPIVLLLAKIELPLKLFLLKLILLGKPTSKQVLRFNSERALSNETVKDYKSFQSHISFLKSHDGIVEFNKDGSFDIHIKQIYQVLQDDYMRKEIRKSNV